MSRIPEISRDNSEGFCRANEILSRRNDELNVRETWNFLHV